MGKPMRFFLDFDGTIASVDVVDTVLERFAAAGWRDIEAEWAAGRIGSRECLSRQMALVRASEKNLEALLETIDIDPGFSVFLRKTREAGIPVDVVSDGFDWIISRLLSRHSAGDLPVHSNLLQWKDGSPRAAFNGHEPCAHGCANCKPAVMRRLSRPGERTIFVGDGLSDRFAARAADLTFAKGKLAAFCETEKIPYVRYTTFNDIDRWLEAQLAHEEKKA